MLVNQRGARQKVKEKCVLGAVNMCKCTCGKKKKSKNHAGLKSAARLSVDY